MWVAGVDLIRRRDVFRVLECNPPPMFAAFEHKTGLDVASPLARLLLDLPRRPARPRTPYRSPA